MYDELSYGEYIADDEAAAWFAYCEWSEAIGGRDYVVDAAEESARETRQMRGLSFEQLISDCEVSNG